jgi:hypothetical protein
MLQNLVRASQLFVLLLMLPGWAKSQQSFDRVFFYKTMATDKVDLIDKELQLIRLAAFKGKEAFEGALQMKKSGLIGGLAKKLNLFKAGHRQLEGIIALDSLNTEYRFLRLMIQEHAPGIVGYRSQLDTDHIFIIKHFKSLQQDIRDAIIDYTKESKVLKPADF